jgi:transcriptional pleiotropic regulator of transition state genes
MKSLGIVRKLDEVGRIVLPKELRRSFMIEKPNDAVEIFTEGD